MGTLYYRARVIVDDLCEYLGYSTSDLIRRLGTDGVIYCHPERVAKVRQGCADMGWEVKEDVRIRLVKRKVGRTWEEVEPE